MIREAGSPLKTCEDDNIIGIIQKQKKFLINSQHLAYVKRLNIWSDSRLKKNRNSYYHIEFLITETQSVPINITGIGAQGNIFQK